MAKGVLMPKAGITVEECVITEWLKKKGDLVAEGDILFTYETDKASFECESTASGQLLEIFYEEGDEVPVLVNVCAIGQPGEDISALRGTGERESRETEAEEGEGQQQQTQSSAEREQAIRVSAEGEQLRHLSPRAKNLAQLWNIEGRDASPSGPHGRVIERDVRALAQEQPEQAAAGDLADAWEKKKESSSEAEYEEVKLSGVRKATAKAMMASLSSMAQLTHGHSFDASALLDLRRQIKERGERMGLTDITLNDMVMFAVSRIVKHYPDLNATMPRENLLCRYTHVHLGMAVDTPRGLLVPTIREADRLSLTELAAKARHLAAICRSGKAAPDMLSGATFTVSNIGALGVEMFTPVINPPQVAILGVCGITDRVRRAKEGMEIYPAMGLCLTYDHRALDGTPASRFMKELCEALENMTLLLMQ